jgi:hypothetical protein
MQLHEATYSTQVCLRLQNQHSSASSSFSALLLEVETQEIKAAKIILQINQSTWAHQNASLASDYRNSTHTYYSLLQRLIRLLLLFLLLQVESWFKQHEYYYYY